MLISVEINVDCVSDLKTNKKNLARFMIFILVKNCSIYRNKSVNSTKVTVSSTVTAVFIYIYKIIQMSIRVLLTNSHHTLPFVREVCVTVTLNIKDFTLWTFKGQK